MLFVLAAWAAPLTLDEAIVLANTSNLELAQRKLEGDAARYRLIAARSGFDPRLSLSVGANQSKTPTNAAVDVGGTGSVVTSSGTSVSVGLSQSLPTGGSVSVGVSEFSSRSDSANALSARFVATSARVGLSQPLLRGFGQGALTSLRDAQLDQAAQDIRWRSQVEQLVVDVSDAYWGLVSATERKAIADRSLELAEQQLTATQERLDAGFAGTGDLLQVQVAVGQARLGQVNANARVGSASDRLARLLGVPLRESATLEPVDRPEVPDTLPDRDTLLDAAEAHNARYALAAVDLERARRSTRRQRNAALPSLSLDAGASWSAGGDEPGAVRKELVEAPAPSMNVGLSLGLPVLPREARANLGQARIGLEAAELAYQAAEQDLELSVAESARSLERSRVSLDNARQTLEHAKRSLAAQKELLSEGRGSTRDVVDALESLRGAEAAELDAQIDLQNALMRAQQLAGTLIATEESP